MFTTNARRNFICLIFGMALFSIKPFAQSAAFSDTTILFETEKDGYSLLHVPALVHTGKTTLLAFCEGRLGKGNDWSDMDLIMRRSTDNGNTWEPMRVIIPRSPGRPTSNITPIVDRNGTIHLLFHVNYATAYYMNSVDDGKTWSTPVDITYVFETFHSKYNWKVLAPGPGHAIQLRNGRLLVPIWLCEPNKNIPGGDHRPSCTATIYSDDHGKTWKPGEIIVNNGETAAVTNDTIVNPNESVAIELADGRVMMNMRNESLLNRRLISYSPDGISKWSKPVFDDELFEPVCMSSLIRVTGKDKARTRMLFVNPDSRNNAVSLRPNMKVYKPRENLTAKLSYDEGETWPVQKVLHDKGAGYSDLAVDNNGTMYCLCEVRESSDNVWKYKMIIRRFNLEWLTDNKDTFKK